MDRPDENHVIKIAAELAIRPRQVSATAELLEGGATVPFIARYRKEATGSLDEVQIITIRDRLEALAELDKRRRAILESLAERGLLTDELKEKIQAVETLAGLEDIYLPYRPKRRTRATVAREKGLEPLADLLLAQGDGDPVAEACKYVDPEKGVESAEEALAGARDIIAERVSEDAGARGNLRELFRRQGVITSRVAAGKEEEAAKYRDYFDWQEPLTQAPSHRVLAMRRGENEGFLSLHFQPDEPEALAILVETFVRADNACGRQVGLAVTDGYKRLLAPSLETEIRNEARKKAEEEAIRVFARNLRELLLAPPAGRKRIMAVDPGWRTGCKLCCLDSQGRLLEHATVFPHTGERQAGEAGREIVSLCGKYGIEVVAVGNGTAGRETEAWLRKLDLPGNPSILLVDESGASVYSASETARDEFPDQDVTVRGAVSIGRRLADPLAELVKIDPKSIGVGQYQHDVDQKELRRSLDDVVTSCVNLVGVELNTASRQLLTYVSGLGPRLAAEVVAFRDTNGPFASRRQLLEVPHLGPRAFEQAAGFLRIAGAADPLDCSAVHPESYPLVQAMVLDLGCSVADLMHDDSLRGRIRLESYVTETIGRPTLEDILAELARPGRDPRPQFEVFSYSAEVNKIEDVRPGMKLPGVVTNITAFGAFVDIGVHQDGLVHISQAADRFVRDLHEVLKLRQRVTVTVLEVDVQRKRISLSLKSNPRPSGENPRRKN
ncbi:MAG: Tex family protein [Candidatus Glassbacteria bacterium]